MFSDRQLLVTSEVINFAVMHRERSFLAAQTLVAWADKMGLSEKRKITIPLVKKVIKQMEREGCKEWT